ncbi:DUF5677 domain-containing protein [Pseudomonas sp. B21-047]|uniref:DUF5677 domain-containing protein n=1 Tax=Pseudomonas sp. B21-047 TaxID=2895489 RepID=UPI00215E782B|nr:DUF5677 domain-containing protein [Pseudomonas sp. B21-047]UVL05967.1 DUF5677 domain-containing protein [Pseudomonas sp. B21-047]
MDLKAISKFTEEHLGHKKQLTVLDECQSGVFKSLTSLDFDKDGEYTLLPKIALYTMAVNLNELNEGMVCCLKAKCYSAVEALARCSLENAINLLLIVNDSTTTRCRSLLVHYLKEAKKRAGHWVTFAKSESDPERVERAESFFKYVALMQHHLKRLNGNRRIPGWPDARSRFIAVGLERQYHILFAPSSDSIHGFSEDVFNRTLNELGNEDQPTKEAAHAATDAEKISFSIYLAASSITMFCEVASILASKVERMDIEDEINVFLSKMHGVLSEHESLADHYYRTRPEIPDYTSEINEI